MIRRIIIFFQNLRIKWLYPLQDSIWKSRRWNLEMTDYEDMSG